MKPIISIIIPTYNRANLIAETLESIVNQTFKEWECIIVDDNSTDKTIDTINPFLNDSRFNFIKKPVLYPKGANSSRNYGLSLSSGDYIYWFDSDDILHPLCLQLGMNYLSSEKVDFCKFNWVIFNNNFDYKLFDNLKINNDIYYIDKSKLGRVLMNEIPINTVSVIWRKTSLGVELFNANIVYADEWEYYSRLISNNLIGVALNMVLIFVRKHPDSTTYEFRNNNLTRINSKKEAIRLVTYNLVSKNLLTPNLLKYLAGLAIGFRDTKLLNDIFAISKVNNNNKLFLQLKYWLFPIWKVYKRIGKK